ncbi:hypothetical protein DFR27_1117 [Umboniibacter marinipuniceus]|uniref:Uncharacterized protein n=1 Tax=Umboniibacter marinipuniceus TaxID=569599 RepID=A0A3M0A813_9GAMM|nr:hypothetical protein DFR27_1117 [Umboniibacter marinipuniceus]
MAQQTNNRPYTRAIELIGENVDDSRICEICEISQPELDLVKRLLIFSKPGLSTSASLRNLPKTSD